MPYADNQGVRIHYQVEGVGPPLVLQHGSTASIQSWYQNGFVEPLQSHYQLILVDARGHGNSDKPHDAASYALPLRVNDIVAVLDDLGIQKAHYWGYSMGGWIGFGMAKHAAERMQSLILGGAHCYADSMDAFQGVDGAEPEACLVALERFVGLRVTPEIRAQLLWNEPQALVAAMHDRDSLEDVMPSMTMPCFLYVGEDDQRFRQVESCFKQMPKATFMSLPGLNHSQANMRADLILPHILRFLADVSKTFAAPP